MPSARTPGASRAHALTRARSALAALLFSILLLALGGSPAMADSLAPPTLASPTAFSQVKANPTFTWSPVARASRYRIQVATNEAFSGTPAYTAVVYGTTATPIAELPLGRLYWRVRTIDGSGQEGVYSDTQAFDRVQADAPVLIGPDAGSTLNYPDDPAVLSWQPVAGMQEYVVQLDDEATFTGALEYETANTSLALPVGLPSKAPRFWRVQGVSTNSLVTTAWSDAGDLRKFSIAWAPAAKPTPLAPADDIDLDLDDIEFRWSAVPGAARYEIQTSTAPDFTASLTTQLTHATRHRPTSTMTQDQYFWRVRALQSNGEATPWSDTSRFKREWLDAEGLQARPALTLEDHDQLELGTQLESDRLYFSWTPVPRASYYEIDFLRASTSTSKTCKTPHAHFTPYVAGTYTGTAPSGFGACKLIDPTAPNDLTKSFLVPGQFYVVKVRAVEQTPSGALRTSLWSDLAREGEGSAPPLQYFELLAQPEGGTPFDGPGIITSSPNTEGSPRLSWQRVDGALTYTVVLARDSSFNSRVGQFETNGTELVINQMLLDNAAGQPYFWFVLPCVKNGEGTTVCTLENTAINIPGKYATFNKLGKAPAGLAAEPLQSDTVTMGWQEHLATSPEGGGVKWYELEVRNASDVVVDQVTTDATGYTPMNEAYPDGQYTWRVRAIDASGTGLGWGQGPGFEVQASAPVPQAPAEGTSLPVLRWTPTAYAGSYDVEVFRGADPAFPNGNKVATSGVTGAAYPAFAPKTALAAGTYSWRVRQVDAYGNAGRWSTQVLPFTIGGTRATHVSPAHQAAAPVPSLVLDWSDVPGAVRYRVESSVQEGFGTLFKTATTTGSHYAPTDAYAGGTLYWWRVHALNASGDTLATSTPTSFTAQTAPLAPPARAALAGTQIQVSWTRPGTGGSDITSYLVRYRQKGTAEWTEATSAGDVTSLTFGSLLPDTVYEAQVTALNAIGTGPFSNTVEVKTPTVPGPPTSLALTPEVRKLTATWRAPSSNGGMPVTGYVVRIVPTSGGTPVEKEVTTLTTEFTNLADSVSYTVDVAARNEVGAGEFVSAQSTTPALSPPPDTTIAGADNSAFNVPNASFTFSSVPSTGSTFECKLDEAAFEPCTSPKSYTGLAEGPHTFTVRAKDAYDQYDLSPAVRSFAIDSTPPDTGVLTGPASPTSRTSAAFTYEGLPALDVAKFECKLDSAPYAACDPTGKTYPTVAAGQHTFSVRAVDKAGNADVTPATYTWTVDTTAPSTTIAPTGPTGTVASRTAEFSLSSEQGATFECKLDAGAYAPCTSPVTYSDLADGSHTLSVRAIDVAGNVDGTPATRTWTVDATAPVTTLTGGPSGRVKTTTAQFTFSSETGAKFECRLDAAAFAACTTGKAYSGLAEGEHTFQVRAIDTVGNIEAPAASRTWTVDTTAPDVLLAATGPSGSVRATAAEFAFSTEEGATLECKLDAGSYEACTSPKAYSGLGAGPHTFAVRATDVAGNVDASPATRTWTIDLTAPRTTIGAGPNGPVKTTVASFGFTASESGSTFECRLDDGGFEPCTSPRGYEQLAEGPHRFEVRARDAAGNLEETAAARTWTVDLTAPDTAITATPAASTAETAAAFTYAGTPAGDVAGFECKLDGGAYAPCEAGGKSYSGLAAGQHAFSVVAVDAAGNADGSPATYAWTITAAATPPPPPPAATPTPGPTPAPTVTPPSGNAKQADLVKLTAAIGGLPRFAKPAKDGGSITVTVPAGVLPSGTVQSGKLTAVLSGRKSTTVGAGRVTAGAAGGATLVVKLNAKARKALKRKKKLKTRLTVTLTAPSGASSVGAVTVTLKKR